MQVIKVYENNLEYTKMKRNVSYFFLPTVTKTSEVQIFYINQ